MVVSGGVWTMSDGVWWCLEHVWWCLELVLWCQWTWTDMTWLDVYGQISFPMPIRCTDAADALMLLMHWSCWCANAADALLHWCCWSNDAAVVDKMQIAVRAHLKGIAWSSEFRTVVQCLVFKSLWLFVCFSARIFLNLCDYLFAEESVRLTVSLLSVHHAFLHHLE